MCIVEDFDNPIILECDIRLLERFLDRNHVPVISLVQNLSENNAPTG